MNPSANAGGTGDTGWIPGLVRSPGEGNGNPLQNPCLENPHRQMSLPGYSPWGQKESDTTERLSVHAFQKKDRHLNTVSIDRISSPRHFEESSLKQPHINGVEMHPWFNKKLTRLWSLLITGEPLILPSLTAFLLFPAGPLFTRILFLGCSSQKLFIWMFQKRT